MVVVLFLLQASVEPKELRSARLWRWVRLHLLLDVRCRVAC